MEWVPNPNGNYQVSCWLELLDTQVFSWSVQWVLLEISWMVSCTNQKERIKRFFCSFQTIQQLQPSSKWWRICFQLVHSIYRSAGFMSCYKRCSEVGMVSSNKNEEHVLFFCVFSSHPCCKGFVTWVVKLVGEPSKCCFYSALIQMSHKLVPSLNFIQQDSFSTTKKPLYKHLKEFEHLITYPP